jgi:hypothetical protein
VRMSPPQSPRRVHTGRAARHRQPTGQQGSRPGRGRRPVPLGRSVRRVQRHRADRSVLRRRRPPPTLPGRGPTTELLPAHHGNHSDPSQHARTGLLPAQRAGGKSHKEALRCLNRRLSDVIYRQVLSDAARRATSPGGHVGAAT